ncbi:hypothetical protein R0J89_16920, partial [Psychrobacter sp. SIMBA_152]
VWWNQCREPCEEPRLAEAFARLPASVYKVEADPRVIGLYWTERGDKSVLQDIAQVFETLA